MLRVTGLVGLLVLGLFASADAEQWAIGRFGGTPTCAVGGGGGCAVVSTSFDSGWSVTLSGTVTSLTITFSTTYSPALRCLTPTVFGLAIPSLTLTAPTGTQFVITGVLTGATAVTGLCFTP